MIKKILLIFFLLITIMNFTVLAGFPNNYTLYNNYIDKTTSKVYEIYFPYGNQYLTKDIENISMSLELVNGSLEQDLEILPDQIYDYYLTDELINSNLNLPKSKILDCNLLPKYKSQELQKDRFLKGKQLQPQEKSKTKIAKFAPQANPNSQTSTLKAGITGCIGVSIKTSQKAKAGDIQELVFDQNINRSKDYEENTTPGTSTLAFIIGDNQIRCDPSEGELFVKDRCIPRCEPNQTISLTSGKCEIRRRVCDDREDTINGNCYQKCNNDKTRDKNGVCRDPNYSLNSFVDGGNLDNIIKGSFREYLIFVVTVLVLIGMLYFYTKKNTKLK